MLVSIRYTNVELPLLDELFQPSGMCASGPVGEEAFSQLAAATNIDDI